MQYTPTPLEQKQEIKTEKRNIVIGLPTPMGGADRRMPLTPEAAGLLVARGFTVKMQTGAGETIHYTDLRYQQQGVDIVDRPEAFRADIVIYLSPVTTVDARALKHGALLLTMLDSALAEPAALRILLDKNVTVLAIDLIADEQGHTPFADILSEIAGRASVAIAASLLADASQGKGILLGGIAGIVPCEVTIIGSGISACAAARSAIGLGAIVRMFDNDTYSLRAAMRELGPGVAGSALHPRVLANALRTADVVVATGVRQQHQISADVVDEMKLGVITFDLSRGSQPVFPSLRCVDLAKACPADNSMDGQRACYINPGNAVPRTVAMALSNTFMTMLSEIFTCDGLSNALMLNRGLQRAALTFCGKAVNQRAAEALGMRCTDINLILQFS